MCQTELKAQFENWTRKNQAHSEIKFDLANYQFQILGGSWEISMYSVYNSITILKIKILGYGF